MFSCNKDKLVWNKYMPLWNKDQFLWSKDILLWNQYKFVWSHVIDFPGKEVARMTCIFKLLFVNLIEELIFVINSLQFILIWFIC